MPWNSQIEQEYDAMLAGPMGQALDLEAAWLNEFDWLGPAVYRNFLKIILRELETGSTGIANLNPSHDTYLGYYEMRMLHLNRAACSFYLERMGILPWSLRQKSVEELRTLLGLGYQGLRKYQGKWIFEGVWDVYPGDHLAEAVMYLLLVVLFGDGIPADEEEMITRHIQGMRDSGWAHMSGWYEDYEGYPAHSPSGLGTYDYYDVSDVKRGGCHITSNFIVATLRNLNVATHTGRPWPAGGPPYDIDEYVRWHHKLGHCFVHFAAIDRWFGHGDDVYNRLLKTYPPKFAMRSDWWMHANHFDTTDYHWSRATAYDNYLWWCLLLGRSDEYWYDVRRLYHTNFLRTRLETIHEDHNLAERHGAPANVPPVFDEQTIDMLMDWVGKKIAEEQNP